MQSSCAPQTNESFIPYYQSRFGWFRQNWKGHKFPHNPTFTTAQKPTTKLPTMSSPLEAFLKEHLQLDQQKQQHVSFEIVADNAKAHNDQEDSAGQQMRITRSRSCGNSPSRELMSPRKVCRWTEGKQLSNLLSPISPKRRNSFEGLSLSRPIIPL